VVLVFLFVWFIKKFILLWEQAGFHPGSEHLELLLGASSLGNLEHIEGHSLSCSGAGTSPL
jgi:hypothetical protein